MTNQAHGSSLVQARGNHQHLHDHHNRLHPRNQETNRHVRDNQHQHPHVRSSEDLQNKKLQDRQVVVVQTLSVVHIVDGAGTVVGVKTLAHTVGQTQSLKAPAGVTTVDSDILGINTPPSIPAVTPSIGDGVAPSPTESVATGVVPASDTSSLSTSSGNLSGSLTSAPLSSSTRFPTLSGPGGFFSSNSTRGPSFFGNSTVKTPHSLFLNTTRPVTVLATKSKTSSTKSRSSTTLWTSTTDVPTVTPVAGPGVGNPGFADATPAVPVPTPSEPAPKGLTPETQGAVAGGVVGGVAGIALLVFFAMFLMRWKKRHGGAIRLLGDGESTARGGVGHGPASGPGGFGGGGGDMTERRSIPFAIPASLASLTGQKRLMDGSAESESAPKGNKGFYRVSGKKLISVLQSGGDGYSDPHDSMISTSSYYRDSMFPDSLPPQRLQLGSPMRPESGVPIMRSGPGRTPVQEQTFSFDAPRPLTSPSTPPAEPHGPDPLGRSLISQDRSRVSGTGSGRTRFTEEI
ncbi:hypothetical protein V8F20_004707 [Naviculisporaceae sp. PSN 640]